MDENCGIITFYSSSHAVHAEKVLKSAGYLAELVPGPKDISPNCGVALRYDYENTDKVKELLEQKGVAYEACHLYRAPQRKSLLDLLLGR
ncbi:MAG: DUF3343 domain-containing protein [Negativicutes bacterium]|nr:DUF3343 domain-containing protein [Negativicutes bacterium]